MSFQPGRSSYPGAIAQVVVFDVVERVQDTVAVVGPAGVQVQNRRRAFVAHHPHEAASRAVAREFVAGEIDTMRVTLLRAARRGEDQRAEQGGDRLMAAADSLAGTTSLNELLGHEGSASREDFQGARRLVDPAFGFPGRQRRPPPDPINAMLSYGYTIVVHEAIAALEAVGLDPMVGFLHQHRWRRPALALDLIEKFRPMTGDVAVWRLVSTRQVRRSTSRVEDVRE